MASSQTFSTSDLRSHAVDHLRYKEQKHKWAFGQELGPGRRVEDAEHARPARPHTKESTGMRRDGTPIASFKHRARQSRKQAATVAEQDTSDSSAEEEVEEASAAPAPDADIAYSYDAARGPSHGSQILHMALAKAVERYEVRATDKLIKEEYEVLDVEPDDESVTGDPTSKTKRVVSAEDEEYEFV